MTVDLRSEIVNQINTCQFELCYLKEEIDCLAADCDIFLVEIQGGFHIECSWIDEQKQFRMRLTSEDFNNCIADRFSATWPKALLDLKELADLQVNCE
jgi:hypothetical protein